MSDKIRIAILVLILLLISLIIANPNISLFRDVNEMILFIKKFGVLAPFISIILIIIQVQIPYVPFFILAGANGILFGFWFAFIITWTATLIGATINFYLSRYLGHDWFARRLSAEKLNMMKKLSIEKGFYAILISRMIPIIPASLINISAGISEIRFTSFLMASALGKLPAIFLYSYLGYKILHYGKFVNHIAVFGLLLIFIYLISFKIKKPSN